MDEDPVTRRAKQTPPKKKSGAEKPPDRGKPHAKKPQPPTEKHHAGNPGPTRPMAPRFTESGAKDRSDRGMQGYRGKAGT